MNARQLFPIISLFALAILPSTRAYSQCANLTLYPSTIIVPDPGGALTTISSCSFTTEHSQVTNIVATATYQFTIDGGNYITVHQGTYDGPVLGEGVSSVTVAAVTNEDLFPTWTQNASCAGMTGCQITTVQLFLNCTPPAFNVGTVNDCANFQFSINVNVTSIGDAPFVNLTYTVDGGAPTTLAGFGVGSYSIGPFTSGQLVNVTVEHATDPACNQSINNITNFPCPIISCGPTTYDYCYGNNDNTAFIYQSSTSEPLGILFTAGSMYQFDGDIITIHDGLDGFAPVLYTGNGVLGDLTGIFEVSTNPDNALTLVVSSTAFTSCSDGNALPWNYVISCYDGCQPPVATYDVLLDCANSQFSIETTISSMGTAPVLDITNTGGAPIVTANGPGVYVSGPFPNAAPVSVDIVGTNALCTVGSPALINGPCPVISCGPDNYTYCYDNFWDSTTVYQSANSFPIAIYFNSGTFEPCCDRIQVYDGLNTSTTPIYDGNGTFGDMTGFFFTSTNPDNALTVVWRSDVSVNCVQGSETPLDWTVSCLDCTNPAVSYELVPDCQHNGYNIEVNVTDLGVSPPSLNIASTFSTDTIFNVGLGITTIGPIPFDTESQFTVLNSQNPLCRSNSPSFTYSADSCIVLACDAVGQDWCYSNADSAFFTYTSGTSDPITLTFGYGQLLVNDFIQIFNGLNTDAQLVYMGNQGGQMAGFSISSSNADNALTLLVISSQAGSCATGEASQWMYWSVGCGLVGVSENTTSELSLYPNPTTGELFINGIAGNTQVEIMDLTGRLVMQNRFNGAGAAERIDLSALQNGNYTVVLRMEDRVENRTVVLMR
ncbi:MAG: T9SS type A sorting domain-containing protein [Flavobacteriales bacterium]|nr:T9SS type A sorting domain-containing protein [Flavobacteriales bacterium]